MAVTVIPVNPLYGGQETLVYGLESTPGTQATTLSGAWYVNVPGISQNATFDEIYPLGTYTRDLAMLQDFAPTITVEQKLQDILFLGTAIRNGSGLLNSYSFLFGDANQAQVALGCKCESIEINIPRQGEVTASASFQALSVFPSATNPGAQTFLRKVDGVTPVNVFQGYNLKFSMTPGANAFDYTNAIRNIKITIRHDIERGPPNVVTPDAGTTYFLKSSFLKEKKQSVMLTFDLYQPMSVANISQLCVALKSFEALLSDYCDVTHLIRLSLPNLVFNQQALQAAGGQDLLSFQMGASATTLTIANT